ncbi:two-component response regulator-like PRR37 isoform X2 [Humulus lupulus]|uniref:two-component response regulator-like PRR37 isoform X2 n=1 Tax=Humulus lupulus TaxID=3486 RepID=UPI002B409ED1|nr:two-component response regulator-like PRR37 isoform X2 [Humulus lupulus]
MKMVQMNNKAPVTNDELAELNHRIQDGKKERRDRVTRECQGLSEEHESRINEDTQHVSNGEIGTVQVLEQSHSGQRRSQQQPQGHLVRWERFLAFRSLKVLLVENDDSTRHIVSALLRNCGYEVTAVENGRQAWKVLEDLVTDVDLVLTEVVMPCLSGIGLLGKIMSAKSCKDIPVIMMSSHDSRSMVFKCLSKGAVDFLVKPIRKNELKNLWQHVWRKCHISSGSGSESGIWIEKPLKSRTVEHSDNNSGSNDGDDTDSIGLNFRNESDSGTQSSWTKRADVDSPQAVSWEQFADLPDSTNQQVNHPRQEAFGNNWVPENATIAPRPLNDELDKKVMGKDLKIGLPSLPNSLLEDTGEKGQTNMEGTNKDKCSELNSKKDDQELEKGELDLNNEEPNAEKTQAVDLMGVSTNSIDPHMESGILDIPNELSKVACMRDNANHENKETPFFELILKRPRDIQDTGTSAHDRNVLRHSDISAFSRYNSASTANQAPTGNIGSCSPLDNSSDAAKTESTPNLQSDSNGTPPNQGSNGSSNNNDMGSTTNNAFTKQVAFAERPTTKSTIKLQSCSGFQQVHNGQTSLQPIIQDASQCGSSNVLRAPMEGNISNQSLNRSGSGSNHGSNGQKRSTTASNSRGKKTESDSVVTGRGKTIEGSESDVNRFAQREAALKRFRQKRQERCFEKKVRYQSRKKLAEQRPRIRGQFIRKGMNENKGKGINYEPEPIS